MTNVRRGKQKVTFTYKRDYRERVIWWGLWSPDQVPAYRLEDCEGFSFKMNDPKSTEELMSRPECKAAIEDYEARKREDDEWDRAHYTPWEVDIYTDEMSPSRSNAINAMVKAGHVRAEKFWGGWTLHEVTKRGREWLCEMSFSMEP